MTSQRAESDPQMFSTVAELGLAYVMMHMQGTPENMQESPKYKNVVDDLLQFFGERIYKLRKLGVNDVLIDPGFGFGKTMEQNFQLLKGAGCLCHTGASNDGRYFP